MSVKLVVGNIVEVTSSEYMHHKLQGQIVGFDEPSPKAPVRVWFGKEVDYLIDYPFREEVRLSKKFCVEPPPESEQKDDLRTWNFAHSELRVCPAWSMKTLSDRHFKNMYHTYYEPKKLFVPGAMECQVEGCAYVTTQRIIFNIWGSVWFADVCSTCAPEYHLKCGERFPWKKHEPQAKTA